MDLCQSLLDLDCGALDFLDLDCGALDSLDLDCGALDSLVPQSGQGGCVSV